MFAAGGATEATHAPLSGERPAVENHAAHASSGVAAVRVAVILRTGAPEMAASARSLAFSLSFSSGMDWSTVSRVAVALAFFSSAAAFFSSTCSGVGAGASAAGGEQPETRTDEEAAVAADRAAFERMTVAELKDLLRARGQRVGGKKAELVERARAPGAGR